MTINEILSNLKLSHAYCLVGGQLEIDQGIKQIVQFLKVPISEIWQSALLPMTIAESRQLIRWLGQTPLFGSRKIAIIPVDKIKNEAISALLKTIEEPPPYATLLVTSPTVKSIAPTILSRCQVVWLGQNSTLAENHIEQNIIDEITSLPKKLEEKSAGQIIDQWLLELTPSLRAGNKVNIIKKLLELRHLTQTNTNPRMILEQAILIKQGVI